MSAVMIGLVTALAVLRGGDAPSEDGIPIDLALEDLEWRRVPLDAVAFRGARMDTITLGEQGLVGVGRVGVASPRWGPLAVWTSTDGLSWSRVPHDEAAMGRFQDPVPRSERIAELSAAALGSRVVVFGDQGLDAAGWTSADGVSWTRMPLDEAVFGGARVSAVTAGGPGLVAVGEHCFGGCVAAVWTSRDGVSWSRVPHDEAIFGGGAAQMFAVTAGGPGLVAVGRGWSGSDRTAAVWTSPDGVTWSRVPHDETVFGEAEMSAVTAGGPGLVAVGLRARSAAVWTSHDGVAWSLVPDHEAVFRRTEVVLDTEVLGHSSIRSVTAIGSAVVAVGVDGAVGPVLWTSPDGVTWSRMTLDEAAFGSAFFLEVITGGPGLVLLGQDSSDDLTAIWVAELPSQ